MSQQRFYQVSNSASGHMFGMWAAASPAEAIARMIRDAGYASGIGTIETDIVATPIDTDRVVLARDNAGNESITVLYSDGSAIVYDATGDDASSIARAIADALSDGCTCDDWYTALHLDSRHAARHLDRVRQERDFVTFDPSDVAADIPTNVTAAVSAFIAESEKNQ